MTFEDFAVRAQRVVAGGRNRLLSNKNLTGASDQAPVNAPSLIAELRKGVQAPKRGTRCSETCPLGFPGAPWR